MPYTKGCKKPIKSGRKKGTPNRKTKELMDVLGSFNPVEKLITIFNQTDDLKLKSDICRDLVKYIYPQRKALEFEQEIELPVINIKGL